MASAPIEERGRTSGEFVESSVLEAIVPFASSAELDQVIASWDGTASTESSSILPFIQQRPFLFFDEIVPVYVVLRTPQTDENTLKSYLSRLEVSVEAYAVSTSSKEHPEGKAEPIASGKELLLTQNVKDTEDPIVIAVQTSAEGQANENGPLQFVYVVWKTEIPLGHPKTRLQKPAVYFKPSATLRAVPKIKREVLEDEYLTSYMPAPVNLLEGLEYDPVFANRPPKLSAVRVSKVAPATPAEKEMMRPIRNGSRRLFRAAPALIWRVRYSNWQSSSSDVSLIASLDIEAISLSRSPVRLDDLKLTLPHGEAIAYPVKRQGDTYPLQCKPGDQTTLIYRLTPGTHARPSVKRPSVTHAVELQIEATALLTKDCAPRISIVWRTNVDFTLDPTPGLGKPSYHVERPSSQGNGARPQTMNSMNHNTRPPGPDSLPAPPEEQIAQQEASMPPAIETVLTVTGPEKVYVGEAFNWNVFVVNKSERARRLALVAMSRRRREVQRHESKPSSSSIGKGDHDDIADAIVDENIVYAKQKNARLEPADLICLSTDVRVGPLAPGACFATELKFLPLSTGVLNLDALRVVDVATNESCDVRDLPSIIVQERAVGGM